MEVGASRDVTVAILCKEEITVRIFRVVGALDPYIQHMNSGGPYFLNGELNFLTISATMADSTCGTKLQRNTRPN